MSVEIAPPPPQAAPAEFDDDRVHSGLFWLTIVAVLIGSMIIGASRVWSAQADKMVTFPLFNHSTTMEGSVTLHVDPSSLAPLSQATVRRFDDVRRIQTPSLLEHRMVLIGTDHIVVAGSAPAGLAAQYVVDDRTLRNLATPEAWSFNGGNAADRSAAYSVNLPFDSGAGPYQIWLNEADRAYTFTQVGQPVVRDDLTLLRLHGHLDAAPVDPQFVAQLSRLGLPASRTLHPAIPASLSSDAVGTLLDPVPLDYTVTADTTLLVEPRTGTIVSVEKMNEVFTAHLDPAHLGAVAAVLDAHRDEPGMATARTQVAALAAAPEAPMFDLDYAQTAASVREMSSYAANQRDWMNRMTRVIPTTLFAVGLGVIGLGVLTGATAWRRRNTEYDAWWEE